MNNNQYSLLTTRYFTILVNQNSPHWSYCFLRSQKTVKELVLEPPPPQNQAAFISTLDPSSLNYSIDLPSIPVLTAVDFKTLIRQVLSCSFTTLLVTLSNSSQFIFSMLQSHDIQYGNTYLFSHKLSLTSSPIIYTANGSYIPISHLGFVPLLALSIRDTYLVSKLSLNLRSTR